MKYRIMIIIMIVCVITSGTLIIVDTAKASRSKSSTIDINRIKNDVETANDFSGLENNSKYNFTIIAMDGTKLFTTIETSDMSFDARMDKAVVNYDTVVDFNKNGSLAGKIVIYTGKGLSTNRTLRIWAVVIPFTLLLIMLAKYYLYMHVGLYRPFKKHKEFALNIAAGNLDFPLPRDKHNLFGEFTESFDIMKEELKYAKQKALNEERSKKELVAALAHDLKTPIAIIRTANQLLEFKEDDTERLEIINAVKEKILEIDMLISDLFHSALNDLSEHRITIKDIEAGRIREFIKTADQSGRIRFLNDTPECLIKADPFRLNQVIGNIISNSYKYAGTDIDVKFVIDGNFLNIYFKDYGTTLKQEDLFLIKNKFYRGKNAADYEGEGLGLYICDKLLMNMDGDMDFELSDDGFTVIISVKLS